MGRALDKIIGVDVDDVAADALGGGEGQGEVLVSRIIIIITTDSMNDWWRRFSNLLC